MATTKTKTNASIELQALEAPKGWQAWLAPVEGGFPASETRAAQMRTWVRRLADSLIQRQPLKLEVFLQTNELHMGDGATELSANGVPWIPTTGLGIWPDRDPPRAWTDDEFREVEVGGSIRPLMHQVLRLTGEPAERRRAREVMLGKGSYVEMLTDQDGDALLDRFRAAHGAKIVDPMFAGFPFLCPLLDSASVAAAKADELGQWIGGSSFYARDSVSDNGLLLIASEPLEELLEAFGATSGEQGTWLLPPAGQES